MILGLFPYFTVPGAVALLAWFAVFKSSRYVSLASILGSVAFPVAYVCIGLLLGWDVLGNQLPLLVFAVVGDGAVGLLGVLAARHMGAERLIDHLSARLGIQPGETTADGVVLTSDAFETVLPWFPNVLAVAVVMFAFSTQLAWSYYGAKATAYLTNESRIADTIYKAVFLEAVGRLPEARAAVLEGLELADLYDRPLDTQVLREATNRVMDAVRARNWM